MERFSDTSCWIFDLDNTLYPAECNLFLQVVERMNSFIVGFLDVSEEEAARLRRQYFLEHGTTLAGLMAVHGVDPDRFLDYVHDIDVSGLPEAPALGHALDALPGRKFIFTNGSRGHAENVAGKLGVLDRFDGVFDIGAAGYVPKPEDSAYRRFLEAYGVTPHEAAMFEDMPGNLETPHALGMVTVLVTANDFDHPSQRDIRDTGAVPDHVHHTTDDLTAFLNELIAALGAPDRQTAD